MDALAEHILPLDVDEVVELIMSVLYEDSTESLELEELDFNDKYTEQ